MRRGAPCPSIEPAMAVADVPFDLVEVKLAAPMTRSGTLAKEAVIGRVRRAGARLATVVAPAGYGKTTLLAHWAEADPRPVCVGGARRARRRRRWCSCGTSRQRFTGSSPSRQACSMRCPVPRGSSWATRVSRRRRRTGRHRGLAGARARRPARCRQSVVPGRARGALRSTSRPARTIAIASREEPPLPLARWRAQGWVHEIGVDDLRLDEQEAALLLAAAGVELDAGEVSELTERTEGWPAGLYLAALSMQAGAASTVSAEDFSGDDRFVSEYFRLELLSRLPAAEARFLKHTSILDRMCGGLCDAVLETTRSAHTLETLGRANGFVVPLDRTRRVVPLPPPLRPAAQGRARAERARDGACAQRSCDGLVPRQRPARGGGRLRSSSGRDGHRGRLGRRP